MLAIVASAVLMLIAVAHSALGEAEILRPLFRREWDVGLPRFAVERVLRFAWHLTSIAWVGLAAQLLGLSAVDGLGLVCVASGAIIFFTLRGHLAWPLFLLAAACAWASANALWPPIVWAVVIAAAAVAVSAAALHVYWAAGGRWGFAQAVPTGPDGRPAFTPGPFACLAAGTAAFALAALMVWPLIEPVPAWGWFGLVVAATLLTVRAIGDGRQAGFTKQDRTTAFARADDAVYTPLFTLLLFGALGSLYLA